tara:strand:- start:1488 stop:2354 length:867 start_codon:yes stop_codon:yes gene_type:complete
MYNKKKTLSSYMGGGYMQPMGYAKGGYRRGLSSQLFNVSANNKKRTAQEELEVAGRKIEKENEGKKFGKGIGSFLGTLAGTLLAPATAGLSIPVAAALGAGIGTVGGGLIGGSGQDASNIKDSSTGWYQDDFEYLQDQGKKSENFFSSIGQDALLNSGEKYITESIKKPMSGENTDYDSYYEKNNDYGYDNSYDVLADAIDSDRVTGSVARKEPDSTGMMMGGMATQRPKENNNSSSLKGLINLLTLLNSEQQDSTGMMMGGMAEKKQVNNYMNGGLIDMKQFGRRIL